MKRKIAAIMAADIAGYSKLVAEDEEETLRRLESYRLKHHALPDSLEQLSPAVPLDPWGHAYEYVNFATRGLSEQRSYHNLPVNSDYDLYSRGGDGLTDLVLNAQVARDDIVRAGDGDFVGLAANF